MIAVMAGPSFRELGPERAGEWLARGHRLRHFFPHRVFRLPKCGPDGYRIAQAALGAHDVGAHWQLVLYADEEIVRRFPRELFFDDDIVWHRQHFGRTGQVATASVVVDGERMSTFAHHADLVQRIGRARELKTQIEKRLGGWPWMMLNALIGFARDRGVARLRVPGSELAMRHTDRARNVRPYLFERVYDRPPAELPGARRAGEWWEIDVAAALAGTVIGAPRTEAGRQERTVCVLHDTERGLGHRDTDPALAARADAHGPRALAGMLAEEARAGVRATYNVVGSLLDDVRPVIEEGGHALAFHSYDHTRHGDQLNRCREVDYRLKGYRLPRSEPTPATADERLALHNFEWLASWAPSLDTNVPVLRNRIVRMPVALDDFHLYTGARDYDTWRATLLEHVERSPFTAVGLHDCYAPLWLDRYPGLLAELSERAALRTLDEVSADTVLSAAV